MPNTVQLSKVFVTVGTTEFDELIRAVSAQETLDLLASKFTCRSLLLQIGRGAYEPEKKSHSHPSVDYYRFKPSIRPDLSQADLVISHAGAGTCLETLELGRPLVVVVNETLHDNHQFELARQLFDDGHLFYCTPQTLLNTLTLLDLSRLKPWKAANPRIFADWLDTRMGF